MSYRFLAVVALVVALYPAGYVRAGQSNLIPETTARRHGMTRPWFTQIGAAMETSRVANVYLYEGILYVQTDTAMISAIDAESGKTLWTRQVGTPSCLSLMPSANRNLLVVVNGSRLYVVNRFNGNLLFEDRLDGAAGAGCAVSQKHAYVPMISGKLEAHRLDQIVGSPSSEIELKESVKEETTKSTKESSSEDEEENKPNVQMRQEWIKPLFSQTVGHAMTQPLVTFENTEEEYVAWCTDVGMLNIARINRQAEDSLDMKCQLRTESSIECSPAYLPPNEKVVGDSGVIFVASGNGFLHAVREKDGDALWQFPTGESIVQSPVAIGDRLYVATQLGGMFCLDAKTGKPIWWTPDVLQFIAASKSKIYTVDQHNHILVLDARNGTPLDNIPVGNIPIKLVNAVNDRIYLVDEYGLIQCLHEADLTKPLMHGGPGERATGRPDATGPDKNEAEKEKADDTTEADKNAADVFGE